MSEKIEQSFKSLLLSLQVAKIYTTEHPKFKESIKAAYDSMQIVLSEREEITIGIVGEEIVNEAEIFFELNKKLKGMIIYLKESGIEKIIFYKGLNKEEMTQFVHLLAFSRDKIQEKGQDYIFLTGIKHIVIGKIKVPASSSKEAKQSVDFLKQYDDTLNKIDDALKTVLDNKATDFVDLKFTMAGVLEKLVCKYHEFLKLAAVKSYDFPTFVHLLNVSILAMYFSSKLGFSRDDVLDIGIAALFHDIGKIYIAQNVLQKPGKLTDEEFSQIKSHTVYSAELLLHYTPAFGILPVVVAAEHHLRYDGGGYPQLTFRRKTHTISRIVTICDAYDALIERRTYKRDYPPDMVYKILIQEKGGLFDPHLLDKFFNIMGVWPIGTIVALDDGRIAIVREENEDDIFSPKVEIAYPERLKELIDLKEKKGKISITHYLNPLNEGKDFVNFI